ncbi:MAG: apolipoprotein N-acyltransferase [Sulfitobacter sp.]
MTLRQRLLIAAFAGAGAALGQAPYDLPPLMLAGLLVAVWLFRDCTGKGQAALVGWAFGTGYFMHALHWIVSPFMVDAARQGWMAPFALVFLAAGLALFWGAAFWSARQLGGARTWPLILTWATAELLRAYVFTGFPWAMPAQALVGVQAGQVMGLLGPYAVNLWLFAAAVGVVGAVRRGGLWRVGGGALGLAMTALMMLPPAGVPSALTEHTIRLIQPNAAQRDKWDPEKIPVFFDRQLQFTAAPPMQQGATPDLVIWSETAIPWSLHLAGTALAEIAAAAGETPVTIGVQRQTETRYFNSMVVLATDGAVTQAYDKHHLVPFGEYVPLGDLLAGIGIYGLAARDGHGYSSGPGAKLLDFGPLGKALPLICYEAVFAHDVNAAPERPAFLIQITNDAWFGKGAGPKQHLAQARMRAIEQGLPLARAANTGISAMIDPRGRVTAALPLNIAGYLDAALPRALPATFYSRTGDLPLACVLLLGLFAVALRSKRVRD